MASERHPRLRELSTILWRERHLFDLLHFKLDVERLLLDEGPSQWIGHAGSEIDLVLDELGQAEMERALVVAQVGAALGLGTEPSLAALVRAAPQPWNALLEGHREALTGKASQVQDLADRNVVRLREAVDDTRQALVRLAGVDR